jgi:hypothetical protein
MGGTLSVAVSESVTATETDGVHIAIMTVPPRWIYGVFPAQAWAYQVAVSRKWMYGLTPNQAWAYVTTGVTFASVAVSDGATGTEVASLAVTALPGALSVAVTESATGSEVIITPIVTRTLAIEEYATATEAGLVILATETVISLGTLIMLALIPNLTVAQNVIENVEEPVCYGKWR